MDNARQDDQAQPFYRAYFEFSRAALSYEPASLAETMTLAALARELAAEIEGLVLTTDESNKAGEDLRLALSNVVRGTHRFGGVPMSAADPALDYLSGCAGGGA